MTDEYGIDHVRIRFVSEELSRDVLARIQEDVRIPCLNEIGRRVPVKDGESGGCA